MAPPQLDGWTAIVRSVTKVSTGLVAVSLRLSDGSVRTVVLPSSLATFDGVTLSAAAVAQLALIMQEHT